MLHSSELLLLPYDSPYGNISAIYAQLIQLRKHLDKKIIGINATYRKRTSDFVDISVVFEINEFVASVKTLMDGSLSMYYLLKSKHDNGVWPKKLEVDCIGGYLSASNKGLENDFDAHVPSLVSLNDAGNALKHSLVNYEETMIGIGVPLCCALYMRNNDSGNDVQLVKIDVNYIWKVACAIASQVHADIPKFT